MKKIAKTMFFSLASIASFSIYSQDMISLKNAEKIKANVKEVSDSEIVFTYDKETVINKLPTYQISQIKFKSGRIQKFDVAAPQSNNTNTQTGNALLDAYNASLGRQHQGNYTPNTNIPYSFDIPEPTYVGSVLLLDENGNTLGTLENQKTAIRSNSDAGVFIVGIGSTKSRQYVKGKILLLARVMNNQFNPAETIEIFKLDQGRKDRSVVVAETHTFGGSKSNEIDYIPFNAYPYKGSSFLIEFNIDQAGEYAIALDNLKTNYNLFGVD